MGKMEKKNRSQGQKKPGKKQFHKGKKGSKHIAKLKGKQTPEVKREKEEIRRLLEQYDQIIAADVETFSDFPLSERTRTGLQDAGYQAPTEIQRVAIGEALRGNDVLGAAKTGSGKTLAFLIPILECLYRNSWSAVDGLGALVISPTRELAYQTFEVLRKIGARHDFSAGLIIGGKDLKSEMERIGKTNIIVCTPGRLLQHMDETACFECYNIKMLVLDEADRILDLGFQSTLDAILDHLPQERQTLLFSATQTKSVQDLARLSLQDPKYISVHEHHMHSTPVQLDQSYIVCELEQKLDVLYSFIKAHLDQKILVFMSSCKQVKYVFEVFCKLSPGISVMALYGSMHQLRRVAVYEEFCIRDSAVLLATDIAARGLDFPAVNWVVQLDCPEDCSTYIHRVGRTARYEKDGEALLVLLPSEEQAMLSEMESRKIPITKIQVNPKQKFSVEKKLQSYCAQSVDLKQSAQRAFIAYLKSVYLMKNKQIFDVHALSLESFARSLGLAVAPRVRFIQKAEKRKEEQNKKLSSKTQKSQPSALDRSSNQAMTADDDKSETALARLRPGKGKPSCGLQKGNLLAGEEKRNPPEDGEEKYDGGRELFASNMDGDGDDDMGDLFVKKSRDTVDQQTSKSDDEDLELEERRSKKSEKPLSKYALAKKIRKKNLQINTKKTFDDEGDVAEQWPPAQPDSKLAEGRGDDDEDDDEQGGINIERAKELMQEQDKVDKQLFKERVKAKHLERKLKEKQRKRSRKTKEDGDDGDDGDEDVGVSLGVGLDDEEEFDPLSLPDPDKFSAFVEDSDDDPDKNDHRSDDGDSREVDDEKEIRTQKEKIPSSTVKRKAAPEKTKKRHKKKQKMAQSVDEVGLSLKEDEQLALHMLSMDRF